MKGKTIRNELLRLAKYRSNDVVKLAFLSKEDGDKLDGLDLTGLTELKWGSNGITEMKLLDRLQVLRLLDEIDRREDESDLGAFLSGLGKGEAP